MSENASDNKQEEDFDLPELQRQTSEEQDLDYIRNADSILHSVLDACIGKKGLPIDAQPSYNYVINEAKDVSIKDKRFIRNNQHVDKEGKGWFYKNIEDIIKAGTSSETPLSGKTSRALRRIAIVERCKTAFEIGSFDGGHLFAIRHSFNSLLSSNKLEEGEQQREFFKKNYRTLKDRAYTLVRRGQREAEERRREEDRKEWIREKGRQWREAEEQRRQRQQQQRSDEDRSRSRQRSDEDRSRSRQRSDEDRSRSRQRSDEDRRCQRRREDEDRSLSRRRSDEDRSLSRRRSDEDRRCQRRREDEDRRRQRRREDEDKSRR